MGVKQLSELDKIFQMFRHFEDLVYFILLHIPSGRMAQRRGEGQRRAVLMKGRQKEASYILCAFTVIYLQGEGLEGL